MYKYILSNVDGITMYPIISMMLFIAVFSGAIVWTWRLSKKYVSHMSHLPLEDGISTIDGEEYHV